jgi:hypothetical protein
MLPDKDFVSLIAQRIFFKCFGKTIEQCADRFSTFRIGMRQLALSRGGMALTHAFMGINMAENGQSSFEPIIENGRYYGFVLGGNDFSVSIRGRNVAPVTHDEVNNAIRAFHINKVTLAALCSLVNTPTKSDGTPIYSWTVDHIDTSRKLFNEWAELDFSDFVEDNEIHQRSAIKKFILELVFEEQYATNHQAVTDYLNFVISGEKALLQNYPCYFTEALLNNKGDRVYEGLGIFGPQVPTMNYGLPKSSQLFSIPRVNSNDPNMDVKQNGKRNLPALFFTTASAQAAGDQWKFMFQNGQFRVPNPQKKSPAGTFTDTRLVKLTLSGTVFDMVYAKVKECTDLYRAAHAVGKRGAGSDLPSRGAKKSKTGTLAEFE